MTDPKGYDSQYHESQLFISGFKKNEGFFSRARANLDAFVAQTKTCTENKHHRNRSTEVQLTQCYLTLSQFFLLFHQIPIYYVH